MTPTPEQSAILDFATSQDGNLMVTSFAGCGKTSTLEMIDGAVKKQPHLFLCFNKAIANEASKRMHSTTTVRTFNSLGHRIWAAHCGSNLKLNTRKTQEIFKALTEEAKKSEREELWSVYDQVMAGVNLARAHGYIPATHVYGSKSLISQSAFHGYLDEVPDDITSDLIDAALSRCIALATKGEIDFNDQVYMPALFGGTYPKFPLVLIDEYQDLSPINHAMIAKLCVASRQIGVGDDAQCHPPGTMINITGIGQRPIETVYEGLDAGYYSTREGRFVGIHNQGRAIEAVRKSDFKGELIKIKVNGREVMVTPNHKCIARLSRDASGHLLYLMRRGNQFRIGISRIRNTETSFRGNNNLGPVYRARQEHADGLWLLDIFPNTIQAQAYEQYYSAEYGLPTVVFENQTYSNEYTELFWELIGDNSSRAKTLLETFDRDIAFPFWTPLREGFVGFHRAGIVEAVNLMPEIMTMLTYPSGNWDKIDIERVPYEGPVYGITVQHREESKRVYLANDILVHNSIYGFRGAKAGGMESAKRAYSMAELHLSVSFRCPWAIVRNVHWRVPEFKSNREGGNVSSNSMYNPNDFGDNSTIICRNNAPLLKCAFGLLSYGHSVSVAGTDIGPRLVSTMRKLGPESLTQPQTLSAIDDWLAAKLDCQSKTAEDYAECMRVFARQASTLSGAIAYAEHLFKQDGTIKLMTGHKAKGLEFEHVYFLDSHLCKRGRGQDANIEYVVSTRAKESLTYIESDGIRWN